MGCYGAETQKGIQVISSAPEIGLLRRTLVRAEHNFDSTGVTIREADGGVTGGPRLKGTQVYPLGYCSNVLRLYRHFDSPSSQWPDDVSEPQLGDIWPDAEVQAMADFLRVPVDRLMV